MRIIFMGTPDFAASSLTALKWAEHEIIGVFCQPDKPQGRKQILTSPPVKALALEYDIPLFQPESLKSFEIQEIIRNLEPELIVVAAYGKILPPVILSIPKYGCINVHGSLLPKYRGAAPIQRAIMAGEDRTGVTIQQMAEGIDTGDILHTAECTIGEEDTSEDIFSRLALYGAKALIDAIEMLDELTPIPQNHELATWAPPLTKEDGLVDFSLDATASYARLRGVSPWPGGYAMQNGRRVKILNAEISEKSGAVGTLLDSKELIIACGTGSLNILKVAPEGSNKQDGRAFINGQRLSVGDVVF